MGAFVALAPGQYVGRYRLTKVAANGKATRIWEARVDGDPQRYVIKTLQPDHVRDKEQIADIRREFEIGHPLSHPRLVGTLELLSAEGAPCLVQELCEGTNLKQRLAEQGPAALAPLLRKIISQGAAGLDYLHGQGWIHRDIKPDNFMATDDGATRLIDLGLAIRKQGFFGRLFSKSKVQGTRTYMSPEQIRAAAIDHRADVYSFGCMVFHLAAGNPPFVGNKPDEVLHRHLNTPAPPLAAQCSSITPEFSALVSRMLEKDPAARPESMARFLAELNNVAMFKDEL